MAGDTFGRRLTTLLTSSLRQVCEVSLRDVTQENYDEYVGSLPSQTLAMPLHAAPIGTGVLELSLPVALAAIDHMLGGPGGSQPSRALTDIETVIFGRLTDQLLAVLTYALEPVIKLDLAVGKIEYNPHFLQVASASDAVVVVDFDLTIARETCRMTVCLPLAGLIPRLSVIRPRDAAQTGRVAINGAIRNQLVDVPVEATVLFDAVTVDSSTVLDLAVGDVIALDHRVGAPLTVRVGTTDVARAIAGKSGTRLAALVVDPPAQLLKETL